MVKLMNSAKDMMHYLPLYWHEYLEMQELLKSQGLEVDNLKDEKGYILIDAFLLEMREERIKQWERWLKLPPIGTLQDRRLAIINYFSQIIKMSRESIQTTVSSMYDGAKCDVKFYDSTIFVTIKIPPIKDDKWQGLGDKFTSRWCKIKNTFDTWQDYLNTGEDWASTPLFNDLYKVLYQRKPCHLKLLINIHKPLWQDVLNATSWKQVKAETLSWQDTTYRTWS